MGNFPLPEQTFRFSPIRFHPLSRRITVYIDALHLQNYVRWCAVYEYTIPITFGAVGAGQFRILSPWNTPCEAAILAVTFGKAGGGISLALGSNAPVAVTEKVAPNDGGARGLYLYQDASGVVQLSPIFFPFPLAGGAGNWNPVTAGEAGNVVIVFRRALDQFPTLPDTHYVNPEDEHDWHRQYQEARAAADEDDAPRQGRR